MLEEVVISWYLQTGALDEVFVCGESYSKDSTPLNYDLVLFLKEQCDEYKVSFLFKETGDKLIKDSKVYIILFDKQQEQAGKAGLNKKFSRKQRLE